VLAHYRDWLHLEQLLQINRQVIIAKTIVGRQEMALQYLYNGRSVT
jgi:hypothetical protein